MVSFLALAAGWSRPRLEHVRERPLVRVPLVVEVVLGAAGVVVFAAVAYAGLAGTDTQQQNLAPTAVYVGFWVGIPFLSLLFGDVFRLLSPWRALGRLTGWVAARAGGDAMPEPLPYPSGSATGRRRSESSPSRSASCAGRRRGTQGHWRCSCSSTWRSSSSG